jgi:hypothetical protein
MKPFSLILPILVSGLLAASCGSDDSSSSSSGSCGAVCGCVAEKGGNITTCNDECDKTKAAGGNEKLSCEAKLDGFGYPECKPKCEGFPTG